MYLGREANRQKINAICYLYMYFLMYYSTYSVFTANSCHQPYSFSISIRKQFSIGKGYQ